MVLGLVGGAPEAGHPGRAGFPTWLVSYSTLAAPGLARKKRRVVAQETLAVVPWLRCGSLPPPSPTLRSLELPAPPLRSLSLQNGGAAPNPNSSETRRLAPPFEGRRRISNNCALCRAHI